jgi:hypothetical protein
MASYEAASQGPGKFDAEAYVGADHPGNFSELFRAYILNRDGEKVPGNLSLVSFQEYLATDPNGIATTEALDAVTNDEQHQRLTHQVNSLIGKNGGEEYHLRMIREVEQHLPPRLDAGILSDPRVFEDAA